MPILIRNTRVQVRSTSARDKFGQVRSQSPVVMLVAVVRLSDAASVTPLRAEQSASHGRAGMDVADGVLLFAPDAKIKNDDQVEVYGQTLKVKDTFPRADMFGRLERGHLEVHLMRGVA